MLGPMSHADEEIRKQVTSNLNALPHFEAFSELRNRLTALLAARAAPEGGSRLCVLGAGNCYDVDLERLTSLYREVHLVDIDVAAIDRAWERQSATVRARLVRHPPQDLSGVIARLQRWRELDVTTEELMSHAGAAAVEIASALPGRFETVVSTCLLSQLQLAVVNVLSPAHPLFDAVRQVVNVTHLRTLAALAAPDKGRALLVSDVSSNVITPLGPFEPGADLRSLLVELMREGKVIHVLRPDVIEQVVAGDPALSVLVTASPVLDAWLWQNGPERTFLVYALELARRAS
jgi:hypothetical protein